MLELDFFWDPVCPWAWATSEWAREVQHRRPLVVHWRPMSLRLLNEDRIDYAEDEFHDHFHTSGLRLLRVAQALREAGHPHRVGEFYARVGARIHVQGQGQVFDDREGVADVLCGMSVDIGHADAAEDTRHDEALRAEVQLARNRVGGDVGVPVLSFAPPDGPSFFGPVVGEVPRGERAERLWDLVVELAVWPGFVELTRSARAEPEFS